MFFNAVLLSLLALPFVAAWTTHNVTVGADGQLVYDPPSITAAVGDTILFVFESDHTATQSTFQSPCSPSSGGFNGAAAGTTPSTFSIKVNHTNPIWVYCAILGHCKAGMVFAVNAPTTGNTYEVFKQVATGRSASSSSSSSAGASPSGSSGGSNAGPNTPPNSADRAGVSAGASLAAFGVLLALVL